MQLYENNTCLKYLLEAIPSAKILKKSSIGKSTNIIYIIFVIKINLAKIYCYKLSHLFTNYYHIEKV